MTPAAAKCSDLANQLMVIFKLLMPLPMLTRLCCRALSLAPTLRPANLPTRSRTSDKREQTELKLARQSQSTAMALEMANQSLEAVKLQILMISKTVAPSTVLLYLPRATTPLRRCFRAPVPPSRALRKSAASPLLSILK